MTKSEFRSYFRKARKDFVSKCNSSQRNAAETALAQKIQTAELLTGIVAGYDAMTSEIDPLATLNSYRENGGQIALPFFADRQAAMQFREWNGEPLSAAPFGLRQPADNPRQMAPDTLLIPLVAVDLAGNRIGQGQGHYDRYLSKNRKKRSITTIGLAWECQIAEEIPADPWDEPLDYIATPERVIEVTS